MCNSAAMANNMSHKTIWLTVLTTLFLLTSSVTRAETQQRIDYAYTTDLLGLVVGTTLLELNLRVVDNRIDAFWTRLTKQDLNVANAPLTTVSIKEFPARRYINIVRRLRSVSNFQSTTVYRELNLCDGPSFAVRFNNKRQRIVDLCGGPVAGMGRIDPLMRRAVELLSKLVSDTLAAPDAVYTKP